MKNAQSQDQRNPMMRKASRNCASPTKNFTRSKSYKIDPIIVPQPGKNMLTIAKIMCIGSGHPGTKSISWSTIDMSHSALFFRLVCTDKKLCYLFTIRPICSSSFSLFVSLDSSWSVYGYFPWFLDRIVHH